MPPESTLAASLAALGSPVRLRIIRVLRRPSALNEIEIRSPEPDGHERPLARQGVRRHLDVLIDAGLVSVRDVHRDYGDTVEFVTNHQRMFLLSEELRALARVRPAVEPEGPTVAEGAGWSAGGSGPRLVLVKGAEDGAAFDLAPQGAEATWVVGRRRDADVSLEYDPSVSAEHAYVRWARGAHWIEDRPSNRNGTFHNFRRLPPGGSARLAHGDLIGVGRSLLLYWA